MTDQLVESKRGEIEFRKKLIQQQVEGHRIFDDEYDASGIIGVLAERMTKTLEQMTLLQERGVPLSPYVEIGAERCQRSLVMENDLGASGAAVDISFDMLKSAAHYSQEFKKTKIPLRLCCDANSLPFKAGSVPFVFCYETLHHFPDPTPIVRQIDRILAPGGTFFFGEEPYRQILHAKLYTAKKMYSKATLGAGEIRKQLDRFFSGRTCNEVRYGIVENDQISIAVWKNALKCFEEKNVRLRPIRFMDTELFNPRSYPKYLLAYLLGGSISGSCRKSGTVTKRNVPVEDMLICPSCYENGRESTLSRENLALSCRECAGTFPIVDDVAFLFTPKRLEELYPHIAEEASHRPQ